MQVTGFVGSLALGWLAGLYGAKRTVLAGLVVWAVVVGLAYLLAHGQPAPFFALASMIGFVLGGAQALSRLLFAQMIPARREAEHFSLYETSDRGTSWLGPLLVGLAFQLTGSYRVAILWLLPFFVLGFVPLLAVPVAAAVRAVGNPLPRRL